jgi:hypothetical protein
MLMVILGAGASHDSMHPDIAAGMESGARQLKPPLARDLFDNRPIFNDFVKRFGCDDLAVTLRAVIRNPEKNLEEELERLRGRVSDPRIASEMVGLRFYLQAITGECSAWGEKAGGLTNYGALARHIALTIPEDEDVCFVTFNYDTLLERALGKYKSESFEELDGYISGKYKVFKVHGSADWGRQLREEPGQHLDGDELRRWMIDRGNDLNIGTVFVRLAAPSPRDRDGHPVLPAISIPVQGKTVDSFECDEGHLAALESSLTRLRKVLVIGWAGNEEHFLGMLNRPNPPEYPLVMVVSNGEKAAEATGQRLIERELCVTPQLYFEGFSQFIGSDDIERFLKA